MIWHLGRETTCDAVIMAAVTRSQAAGGVGPQLDQPCPGPDGKLAPIWTEGTGHQRPVIAQLAALCGHAPAGPLLLD